MTNPTDETAERQVDSDRADSSTGDEMPEIACTLTSEQVERRENWMKGNLLPHVEEVEERDGGFSIAVDRRVEAYRAATELAWKESQCCAWATFEVELPPGGDVILWTASSGREEGRTFFDEHLQETVRRFENGILSH